MSVIHGPAAPSPTAHPAPACLRVEPGVVEKVCEGPRPPAKQRPHGSQSPGLWPLPLCGVPPRAAPQGCRPSALLGNCPPLCPIPRHSSFFRAGSHPYPTTTPPLFSPPGPPPHPTQRSPHDTPIPLLGSLQDVSVYQQAGPGDPDPEGALPGTADGQEGPRGGRGLRHAAVPQPSPLPRYTCGHPGWQGRGRAWSHRR